jgi:hypothetical protein
MTTTALTTTNTEMSLSELGNVLTKSKYFTDATDASQAIVKVLAGRELGIGPIASMTGIHIIKGKPALGANLLASCLKRSGRYDYRVKELTAQNAAIEFFEVIGGKRESLGISSFSIADARAAGTQNIDKYARNMLFARALSNGVRWYCPDVTGGPVYTPEELGASVNGDGEIIESSAKTLEHKTPPTPPPAALTLLVALDEIVRIIEANNFVAPADRIRELFGYACAEIKARGMECEGKPNSMKEAANSTDIMLGRCLAHDQQATA